MSAWAIVFVVSVALVTWVYVGYPLSLVLLSRLRPRPRRREPIEPRLSVVVAAHNEAAIIGRKVEDVRNSDYPSVRLEVIVASNGSTDATAALARAAGADIVVELPEPGKLPALVAGVERSSGEILVFTDADTTFDAGTLRELVSNFADAEVGGVSANEIVVSRDPDGSVVRGEGLYWRYDQWIKRLEDRIGSTVSASGRLYAVRRELFRPPQLAAGADDFLISTQVVAAGRRLAFDERALVYNVVQDDGGSELRRKVRMMNQGQRAAFSLGRLANPLTGGLYAFQLISHQVLRRFVPFFLVAALVSSVLLTVDDRRFWLFLGPQLVFYALALLGWVAQRTGRAQSRLLWIPYFFCLANLAAAIAMVSLAVGTRYRKWEPSR